MSIMETDFVSVNMLSDIIKIEVISLYNYIIVTSKINSEQILQSISIYCIPRMWLTPGRASGRNTLLQYSSLTPPERECYTTSQGRVHTGQGKFYFLKVREKSWNLEIGQ